MNLIGEVVGVIDTFSNVLLLILNVVGSVNLNVLITVYAMLVFDLYKIVLVIEFGIL